jgi:hypothetical protein
LGEPTNDAADAGAIFGTDPSCTRIAADDWPGSGIERTQANLCLGVQLCDPFGSTKNPNKQRFEQIARARCARQNIKRAKTPVLA